MKMKLRDVYVRRAAINKLRARPLPTPFAFSLVRSLGTFREAVGEMDKRVEAIRKKYGEKQSTGAYQIKPNTPEADKAEKELDKMFAEDVEIKGISPIPESQWKQNVKEISVDELEQLDFLIQKKQETMKIVKDK